MITPRLTVLLCTLAALPFAATAESLYYDVPVTVYSYTEEPTNGYIKEIAEKLPVENSQPTTVTAQLLSIRENNTTPALQLIVKLNRNTVNVRVDKHNLPPEAAIAFTANDYLDLMPDNVRFSDEGNTPVIFNLLSPEGHPWGKNFYIQDAAHKPLANYPVVVTYRPSYSALQSAMKESNTHLKYRPRTTQTLALDANGFISFPPKAILNTGENIEVKIEELQIEDNNSTTHELKALSGLRGFYTDTVALPFLQDWTTSHPDVVIVSGTFVTPDNKPAAGIRYSIRTAPPLKKIRADTKRIVFSNNTGGTFRIAHNLEDPDDENEMTLFVLDEETIISHDLQFGTSVTITVNEPTTGTETLPEKPATKKE